jgi:hypothetical protein
MKYAADNGYERVGLTTGKQQVDRFSDELRQNVDQIDFSSGYPSKDTTTITATKNGQPTFEGNVVDGKFIDGAAKGKTIDEVLGKSIAQKVELGRTVLDGEILAKVQSDSLNASFSNEQLEEGVVLLATREDDGSFAIRRVVQSGSAVKSALAACSSVGAEKEKAQKLADETKAIEDERLAAQAKLKAA